MKKYSYVTMSILLSIASSTYGMEMDENHENDFDSVRNVYTYGLGAAISTESPFSHAIDKQRIIRNMRSNLEILKNYAQEIPIDDINNRLRELSGGLDLYEDMITYEDKDAEGRSVTRTGFIGDNDHEERDRLYREKWKYRCLSSAIAIGEKSLATYHEYSLETLKDLVGCNNMLIAMTRQDIKIW